MTYKAKDLLYLLKTETLTANEDGEIEFVCSKCLGEGYIEEMGGEDWDLIGEHACPDCNEE